jgi:CXXC-20-CXXC protein
MKKCSNCHKAFSKKQIVISSWLAYRNIQCSNCGTQYEHSMANRLVIGLIALITITATLLTGNHYKMGTEKFFLAAIVVAMLTAAFSGLLRFKKVN